MDQNNENKTESKRIASKLGQSLYLVLIIAILMSTASYSWFSLSRTPTVSDMGLFISNLEGLQLSMSKDAPDESWSQELNFSEILKGNAPLRPVTWSEKDQTFYAATYGSDGRIIDLKKKLADEINSTAGHGDTYYMKLTFFARTGQAVKVGLSPAATREDGTQGRGTYVYGTPVWNPDKIAHDNAGGGSETAIRIGFKISIIEEDGNRSDPVFYIYEPNCGAVDPETGEGYRPTSSVDGTWNLIPEDRLIRQTTSTWGEADPAQRDVVSAQLGEFMDGTTLFRLKPEQIAQIDLYIWLEGMDADCVNEIGEGNKLSANIQFSAEPGGQGGMTDIED